MKALEGEEFLLSKPEGLGTLSYSANEANLPSFALISDVAPWINAEGVDENENSIGPIPTTGLFNDGDPSIIHGEVVVTLD